MYNDFHKQFSDLRKVVGIDHKDKNGKRCEINLKSFREYARTKAYEITHDQELSEYYFGHKHIRYKNKGKMKELEDFKIIEPMITFLDVKELSLLAKPDMKKIEQLENQVQKLNALIHYSDLR